MKKAIVGMLMFALALASVSAAIPTGFHLDKSVLVTGDWAWDVNHWEYGNFPTASFVIDTDSWKATSASYMEVEKLGQAWKYELEAMTQTNTKTRFHNTLNAITVNPPDTTPGTAWTKVEYGQLTAGTFSTSGLSVSAYGNVLVDSKSFVKSPAIQQVNLDIN